MDRQVFDLTEALFHGVLKYKRKALRCFPRFDSQEAGGSHSFKAAERASKGAADLPSLYKDYAFIFVEKGKFAPVNIFRVFLTETCCSMPAKSSCWFLKWLGAMGDRSSI